MASESVELARRCGDEEGVNAGGTILDRRFRARPRSTSSCGCVTKIVWWPSLSCRTSAPSSWVLDLNLGGTSALGLLVAEESDKSLPDSSSDESPESSPGTGGSPLGWGVSTYRDPYYITILIALRVSIPRDVVLSIMTCPSSSSQYPIPQMKHVMYGPIKMELIQVCYPWFMRNSASTNTRWSGLRSVMLYRWSSSCFPTTPLLSALLVNDHAITICM